MDDSIKRQIKEMVAFERAEFNRSLTRAEKKDWRGQNYQWEAIGYILMSMYGIPRKERLQYDFPIHYCLMFCMSYGVEHFLKCLSRGEQALKKEREAEALKTPHDTPTMDSEPQTDNTNEQPDNTNEQ